MSTQEPRDYRESILLTNDQQRGRQGLPAANTFPGRQRWRVPTTASFLVSLLQQHRARDSKTWPLILLLVPAMLVIIGGLFGQDFIKSTVNTAVHSKGKEPVQEMRIRKHMDTARPLTKHMRYKQLASLYVDRMSLDEKLGQLIVAQFNESNYSPDLDMMVSQQHIGGVILFTKHIQTIKQVQADTAKMQSRANFPLLIGTDQEGLTVNRLANIYGQDSLTAWAMQRSGNLHVADNEGKKAAQRLLNLGINLNFAPDIDVGVRGGYIDGDYRSFGYTVDDVIKYAGAYVRALQGGGVIACFKHFPGLGGVPRDLDPHKTLPTVNRDKDHIYNVDIAPFKHFIQSTNPQDQADMIMVTDVLMPAIDPQFPAVLSRTFITDILRTELAYDGVVVSDSLHMGGVKVNGQHLSIANAAVLAIQAGVDIALNVKGSTEVTEVINGLKAALQNRTLTEARIDEAATRIIALKMKRHLMPAVAPT